MKLGYIKGTEKLKIIANTDTEWQIEMGYLEDTFPMSVVLKKDKAYNAIFYSFISKSAVNIEPKNTNWDLCFTQYIYNFKDFDTYYLVSGLLLKPVKCKSLPRF